MKIEFRVTLASFVGIIIYSILLSTGVLFIKDINKHQLPYNFKFVYLPFGPFMSPKWFIQYLLQFVASNFATAYFYFYSLYTLLIMNYSCWEIDALRSQVERMFQPGEMSENLIDDQVKKTIFRSYRVMSWMNEARALFRISFFTDFSLSSFILCMCFYTWAPISLDPFRSSWSFVCFFCKFPFSVGWAIALMTALRTCMLLSTKPNGTLRKQDIGKIFSWS